MSEEDIKNSKRTLDRLNDKHKELQLEFEESTKELTGTKLDLGKIQRKLEEVGEAKTRAKRLRLETEIEFRRLLEVKLENDKDIRALQTKNLDLQFAIESLAHHKIDEDKERAKAQAEVEEQRKSLKEQQLLYNELLENERRSLQQKFRDERSKLHKTFQDEATETKDRYENHLRELEQKRRTLLMDINVSGQKKLEVLEHQKASLTSELHEAERTCHEKEHLLNQLEKQLHREILNSEVLGTSKIDWIKSQSIPESLQREIKSLDKKVDQLRYKINEADHEIAMLRHIKETAENTVLDLKRELEERDLFYSRLESSKEDSERRLQQKINELTESLNQTSEQQSSQFTASKVQLEATIAGKGEVVKALKEEIDDLETRLKGMKQHNTKLATKLGETLDQEKAKYSIIEKEKREAVLESRQNKKQSDDLREKLSQLERENEKHKGLYQSLTKSIEELQAKNLRLERAARRLETKV